MALGIKCTSTPDQPLQKQVPDHHQTLPSSKVRGLPQNHACFHCLSYDIGTHGPSISRPTTADTGSRPTQHQDRPHGHTLVCTTTRLVLPVLKQHVGTCGTAFKPAQCKARHHNLTLQNSPLWSHRLACPGSKPFSVEPSTRSAP